MKLIVSSVDEIDSVDVCEENCINKLNVARYIALNLGVNFKKEIVDYAVVPEEEEELYRSNWLLTKRIKYLYELLDAKLNKVKSFVSYSIIKVLRDSTYEHTFSTNKDGNRFDTNFELLSKSFPNLFDRLIVRNEDIEVEYEGSIIWTV